jgi:flagellar protein FliS
MNGLAQYRGYQVESAGPEEQIVLLYDGARRFVDHAEAALKAGRLDEVSRNIGKAQRIFEELACMLNLEAGEVARNLSRLYEYWGWRLSQGLIKKDPAMFAEVSATLVEMHEAWSQAVKEVRSQRAVRSLG